MKPVLLLAIAGMAAAVGASAAVAMKLADRGTHGSETQSALIEQLDRLDDAVAELHDDVLASRDDVLDLNERIVALELDLSRRQPNATTVSTDVSTPHPSIHTIEDATSLPSGVITTGAPMPPIRSGRQIAEIAGGLKSAKDMQQRFATAMKLRQLPEDERWALAEEKLGLNSVQTQELRDAATALAEELDAATTTETVESGGFTTHFRKIDHEKASAARKAYDDRVDNVLNDDQKSAWNSEGWNDVFGRKSRGRIRSVGAIHTGDGQATPGAVIISTGTLEVETSDD